MLKSEENSHLKRKILLRKDIGKKDIGKRKSEKQ